MARVPDDHLSIRVEPDLIHRIDALAKEEDRTRSNMARRLLLEALAAREAK
jgi:predicted transcriptional regulator